jgi:hypothetical protein
MIKGIINNVPTKLILDTGSGITVMGGRFFDTYLKDEVELLPNLTIASATNNQLMTTRGMCQVLLTIGTHKELVWFKIIEEVENEVIIGTSEMAKWQMIMDFANGEAELCSGTRVKLQLIKEKGYDLVAITKTIQIPPKSRKLAQVKFDENITDEIRYIHTTLPVRMSKQIYIQDGIIKGGKLANVWINNETNQPVILYRNSTIGRVVSLETDVIRVLSEEYLLKALEKASDKGPIDKEMTNDKDKIIDQIDKMKMSDNELLSKEEQIKLKSFLKDYWEIFAVNPKQPGTTPDVKHYINTGDAEPIKQ